MLRLLISITLLQSFLISCEDDFDLNDPGDHFLLVNELNQEQERRIDLVIDRYMSDYQYISVGLVSVGTLLLVKSYNEDRTDKADVYASVSKPVTAMICLSMLEQGLISDLDDPISQYSEKYRDIMPDRYGDTPLTFRHLLCHEGGVPHHDRIWEGGKLDLQFRPGTGFLYSTRGYGILGDVLAEIGDRSYSKLLMKYIEEPVGAISFSVPDILFEAPGGLVRYSVHDMALFARGVMDGTYAGDSIMYHEAWHDWARDGDKPVGLGWYLNHANTDSLAVYHAGSNGKPRAFIALRPWQELGIVLQGRHVDSDGSQRFYDLAKELMNELLQF